MGAKSYTLRVSKGINMLNTMGRKRCALLLLQCLLYSICGIRHHSYMYIKERKDHVKHRPSRSKLGMDCALTLSCHFK
jgi:hypothetical protein